MSLTTAQRAAVGHVIRECASQIFQELPNMSSGDVDAAVAAADVWQDDNAASYNSALPEAFRTNATAAQKTLLFMAVAMADYFLDDADSAQVLGCMVGKLIDQVGGA